MKNKLLFYYFILLFSAVSFVSCEKYSIEDDSKFNESDNSTLIVRARAPIGVDGTVQETSKISYPISVYVFNENKCINISKITSEEDELILNLNRGCYDIYAVAGANDELYELPTKETATRQSIIRLREGANHNDLMLAYNNIVLDDGEENTLTLALERKVMLLESITMNDIPNDVTEMSVSICPLYENLLLDGSYAGESGVYTVILNKKDGTNTWSNDTGIYMLEAANKATLKVSMVRNGVMKSYSYSCAEDLKANYKININGKYIEDDIKVSGTITGAKWAGNIDIDFTFKDEHVSEPPSSVPEVGTLYKDCFVLKSEKSGSRTLVTLFTTSCKNKLQFIKGDQESMKNAIDAGIEELAVEGITGWRLPSVDELRYIKDNSEFINGKLREYDKAIFDIEHFNSYFCLDIDGKIKIYCPNRNDLDSSPSSGLSTVYLYAFTTIEF